MAATGSAALAKDGVAVVTGAASGLGAGLARALAARGLRVVLADVATDRLNEVARAIDPSGARAIGVPTDVTDASAMERLAATAHERFGDVSLLVNNAGIETVGFTWEIPAERWKRTVDVNVLGAIYGVRAFAPRMIARGAPAAIVNVASVAAVGMMPLQTSYMLTKHAVLSFSECLALEFELANAPVQVSVVLAGPVNTRIFDDAMAVDGAARGTSAKHRAVMQAMLSQHGMTPDEAAAIIVAGVEAGDFWISTHPDMTAAMADGRAEYLKSRARPALTEQARSLLD
jgi:NAD(P)-dependent dehydrogenase (short-subunit alcohol dehydrogenase family)